MGNIRDRAKVKANKKYKRVKDNVTLADIIYSDALGGEYDSMMELNKNENSKEEFPFKFPDNNGGIISLEEAKRLHQWLGKSIRNIEDLKK